MTGDYWQVSHNSVAEEEAPPHWFPEDELGECCSRILRARGHMEYS